MTTRTTKRTPVLSAVAVALALAGCGGGGGGGSMTPSGPPTATTGLTSYLPLAVNNTWTFSSGGQIVDRGASTLSCSCAYNGGAMEAHDLMSPSGVYSGTFYYAKASGVVGSGSPVTFLVGTSTSHGTAVTLAGSLATSKGVVPGLGIVDDNPSSGETFGDPGGDVSTLSSVGQTLTYANTSYANNATDTISGANFSSIVWTFARGIGYTNLSYEGQTTTIVSFAVSRSSAALMRSAAIVRAQGGNPAQPGSIVRSWLVSR